MTHGDVAWIVLGLYIAIYDALAMVKGVPTMSAAFHRTSRHRVGRPITLFIWVYLTAHLFYLIPKRYDPLRAWR